MDLTEQFQAWCVCQVCGRVIATSSAEADGWLVGPYRLNPRYNVVRCYAHWSEWAMRNSLGRTNANRAKAKQGKERAANEHRLRPLAEPFPMEDRDDEGRRG